MTILHDQKTLSLNFKSSCSQMFFKIGVLIKKRIHHRCLLANIAKFLMNTYFEERLQTAASALIMTYYNHKVSYQVLGTCWQKHNMEWFLLRFLDLVRHIRILMGLDDRSCRLLNVYFSDMSINLQVAATEIHRVSFLRIFFWINLLCSITDV